MKLFLGGKMVFFLLQSSSNSLFQPFYNTELGTAGGGINPQKTRRYEEGRLRLELVVSWQVNLTKVYPCSWAHLRYFQCWEKHGLPRANFNGNGSEKWRLRREVTCCNHTKDTDLVVCTGSHALINGTHMHWAWGQVNHLSLKEEQEDLTGKSFAR